jgi:Spy/CpxP family protein refolding chaperone
MIATAAAQVGHGGQGKNCPTGHGAKMDCAKGMMQGHGMKGKQGDGIHRLLGMADKIGLTEAQTDQLKAMAIEFKKSTIDDQAELKKTQLDLHALRADDGKTDDVLSLMDKIGRMKTEMQKNKYLHRQQIQAVLTDDQRDQLKELRQKMHNKPFGSDSKGNPHDIQKGHGMGHGGIDCNGTGFGSLTPDES